MNAAAIKKRDKEQSISRLIEAGVAVFSTHGYDAATTKLIAQHAGINESLISRYFNGKAGLLVEIIRGYMEKECDQEHLREYPAGATIEEEILNFFQHKFEHFQTITNFLKVVVSRAIIDPDVAQEVQKKTYKKNAPVLLARFKALQEKGVIKPEIDVDRTCFTISHMCFSLTFLGHSVMGLDKKFVDQALKDFASHFAKGISIQI